MADDKQVTVVFDGEAEKLLERIRQCTGRDTTNVIGQALGFYAWAMDHVLDGNTIAIVDTKRGLVCEYNVEFRKPRAGG